jgi:hypothetical protein
MRKVIVTAVLLAAASPFLLYPRATDAQNAAGHPLVIELDNKFIATYANRATITSEFTIAGISQDHPDENDGEVHNGGWAHDAGLPCVAEVMNVRRKGKETRDAFHAAFNAGKKVTVTGAWRIWGEHAGGGNQIQSPGGQGPMPAGKLPGAAPSNPDHVFEIHPVTVLKVDNQVHDATPAIGDTLNFPPKDSKHDAHHAFVDLFERTDCTIVPKGDRTRIVTWPVVLNFTEFMIRPEEDVKELDDGHAVICTVFDTDGEQLVRNRRMIFIKGTSADKALQQLKKDGVLQVVGFARIDLALVQWRVQHRDDTHDKNGNEYAVPPLQWRLPYEMIIVSAKPFNGGLID